MAKLKSGELVEYMGKVWQVLSVTDEFVTLKNGHDKLVERVDTVLATLSKPSNTPARHARVTEY